jgi:aspartyl-tRNA(Asn)/glutamyl-tRNA(Gln) amidotransferase subunit B
VIGLEVHAQITTNAKLFSGAATALRGGTEQQVSLVDAAMPGMLPVPNRECIAAGRAHRHGDQCADQQVVAV